jgi:hypothetical protein
VLNIAGIHSPERFQEEELSQNDKNTPMRKRIINQDTKEGSSADQHWLDLERLARVEITSEDPTHPIEAALKPGTEEGWRAAEPGEQIIRLLFDKPQELKRIYLIFSEETQERTQEFTLQWSSDGGQSYQEIVRQQYNFSPKTREVEDYNVDLKGVTVLELKIVPDINEESVYASLAQLSLA